MDGRRYGLSVGLKEREKVIVAVAGQVGRAEIGQQLIWICEFWNKLQTLNKKTQTFNEIKSNAWYNSIQ